MYEEYRKELRRQHKNIRGLAERGSEMGIGICMIFILAFIIVFQQVLPTAVIVGFAIMGVYIGYKGFVYEEEKEANNDTAQNWHSERRTKDTY